MLAEPVNNIKGIGDRAAADFAKMKIFTHKDLLEHFPLRYEYYPYPVPVEECHPAKTAALQFILNNEIKQTRTGNGCYVRMNVNGRTLMLLWFHNPYLRHMLHLKQEYIFLGSIVEKEDGSYIMTSSVFFTPEQYIQLQGTYDPVYRQTKNLRTTKIQKAIGEIKEEINLLEDQVTEDVQQHFDLMPYKDAVRTLHFPGSKEDIEAAKRSICISELYGYLSEVHKRKKRGKTVYRTGIFQPLRIPFSLTEGQQNVWDDIMNDLNSGIQMRRLIQGDVGSGKSVIAFLSMAAMAQNGYQSVLLAPTEILAQQHFQSLQSLLESNQLLDYYHPVLLTGSTSVQEKKEIYENVLSGFSRIIVGTHAVLNDHLRFHALGLIITDEQHRFGVEQRDALDSSGYARDVCPHILAMSATPIPRTLSGILYGDMDISIIRTKPEGRKTVKNCLITDKKRSAGWSFIAKEVKKGRQAYIVCSMVDENDNHLANVMSYKASLGKAFSQLRADVLYGAMPNKEKENVMKRFLNGEIDVLISTTVIEVGVNVPNATVMMIENAERFGLAQLHQLRGRIGRGDEQSYCIFIQGDGKEESERLRFISSTNDGFLIAEKDMELRGAGDLTGTMQSGQKKFRMANIYEDLEYINQINDYLKKNILDSEATNRQQPYLREDGYLSPSL